MSQIHMTQAQEASFAKPSVWPWLAVVATFVAYIPTFIRLAEGPWQTEQEGHGPLIFAASLWLVWSSRDKWRGAEIRPAPVAGWAVLLLGLAMLFLSRILDLISTEAFSELPVIIGCVLLLAGWEVLRALAFPIFFLVFAVPAPGWIVDSATVPLKVFISDLVTKLLYALDYPIAQNGVVIMIGPYQLLMKDACAGMNSIFALSAIGMFYVYAFRWNSKLRALILLAAIVPITIVANFIRVMALVLISYYGGVELIDGILHDLTGIALFVISLALVFICDGLLGLLGALARRIWPRSTGLASPKRQGAS
jgi:exosortase B